MSLAFSKRVRASFAGAILIAAGALDAHPLLAQTNLPPVAAPTTSVAVESLPVVRSESQQVTDYARGLFEGLLARENIDYGALAIVSRDRADMAEVFGDEIGENAVFALGSLSDLFGVVAIMQLAERERLGVTQDLAAVLDDEALRGSTVDDLLTHRLDDSSALLAETVRRLSGVEYGTYISEQILSPLGMTRSRYEENVGMLVTIGDMSRFLIALTNATALQGQAILMPTTIELMQRRHYADHPELPGWAYGFAEMQRKGRRALQRDAQISGSSPFQSRVVLIPELQIAYFVSISGQASPAFWRALDDNLFDRLAPQDTFADESLTPSGSASDDALELQGLYRSQARAESAVFLNAKQEPLYIEADGAILRLSGAEDIVLRPAAAGVWRADATQVPAAFLDGVFRIGNIAYEPVRAWQQAGYYLALAVFFAMLASAALLLRGLGPSSKVAVRYSSRIVVFGLAAFSALFAALAVALHSWT